MAASTITRDTLTNDTGSFAAPNGDGTVLNNSLWQNTIYARFDAVLAGAGAYATLELGGLLKADGFGTHTFSAGGTGGNVISIRNTTAGTGNFAQLIVGNDVAANQTFIQSLSSTYTTASYNFASGSSIGTLGSGGLSLVASNAVGVIRFYTGVAPTLQMQLDSAGVLTVNGFGTHTFSAGGTGANTISIRNTTAGIANYGLLAVGNDSSATLCQLYALSSTYTTGGQFVANGMNLSCTGAGGISIATNNAAGVIRFYTGSGVEQMRIDASGNVLVGTTTVGPGPGGVSTAIGITAGYDGGTSAYVSLTPSQIQVYGASAALKAQLDATGLKYTIWPTTASATNAVVGDTDYIRRTTSLRANKHDIVTITASEAIQAVAALRPVLYRSRVDDDQRLWPGFIAEEVETAAPHLATYGSDGVLQSVAYDRVPAYLVAAVQALTARLAKLEAA